MDTPTALVTGASKGLGRALASALNDRGWRLVVDGRDGRRLSAATA
jgi:NAD(P)-dependent dehydrogenase (short-subunit alcohol dehydrogenase family)